MEKTITKLNGVLNQIRKKDSQLFYHSLRVALYSVAIAEEIKIPPDKHETLFLAGLFHDIGKIKISSSILNKIKPLTINEFKIIKKHPLWIDDIKGLVNEEIIKIIRHHHEWYDGTGYPDQIANNNIPLFSRIISVADAVDAMRVGRPYSKPKEKEEVIEELEVCSNTQFDPKISKTMVKLLKKPYIYQEKLELLKR